MVDSRLGAVLISNLQLQGRKKYDSRVIKIECQSESSHCQDKEQQRDENILHKTDGYEVEMKMH